MTDIRFKPGDRVRALRSPIGCKGGVVAGDTGTVTEESTVPDVAWDGKAIPNWSIDQNALELIADTQDILSISDHLSAIEDHIDAIRRAMGR